MESAHTRTEATRSQSAPSSPVSSYQTEPQANYSPPSSRTFKSPRLQFPDEKLFPAPSQQLCQHDGRWEYIAGQAGSHKQDGSVLRLNARMTSPQVLKNGMPPQAAKRITEIHLPPQGGRLDLPAWIDAIQSSFFNLEHLYVGNGGNVSPNANKMQRLYIIYRLPNLKSIDGVSVTVAEQRLARPNDPNGRQVKRNEWVNDSMAPSLLDKDEFEELPDDVSSSFLSSDNMAALSSADFLSDVAICPVTRKVEDENASDLRGLPLMPSSDEEAEEKKDEEMDHEHSSVPEMNDKIKFVDSESSVSCQWSAGCGSLAFLRNNMKSGKFQFKFGRKRDDMASVSNDKHENSSQVQVSLLPRSHKHHPLPTGLVGHGTHVLQPSLSEDSTDWKVDGSLPSTPRNRSSSLEISTPRAGPREPLILRSEKRRSPCTYNHQHQITSTPSPRSRISGSESLSSPFPMQFRAKAATPPGKLAREYESVQSQSPRTTSSRQENLLQPLDLVRTKSLPTTLSAAVTPSHLSRRPRGPSMQDRQARWQRKLNARTMSLMDEDGESEEEEIEQLVGV